MTTEPTPLVTVLPCDRLAARDWIEGVCKKMLANDREHNLLAETFARHRLAALEEGREQAAGLAEMGDWDSWSALATAIRALSNKTGEGSGDEWLVPGPCWGDDAAGWVSEVQIIGGHEVIATVYADTQQLAAERRDTVLAALAASNKGGRDGE